MSITRSPFRGMVDVPRILPLVAAMPLSSRHVVDLPWRLSTPRMQEGRDAVLWEDTLGQIVGFAAWQYYWAALDFFILPGPTAQQVEQDIFAWAEERFQELDAERGRPLPYWVEFRDDDLARRELVEARGYLLDEGDHYVALEHPLTDLPLVPALPEGFTLRPLAGEQEVAAYAELHRAAFESTSMTPEWRARTLQMPQYRPELDIVVSAPGGELAGFCVGWLAPERGVAQIEPLGVHPRYQHLGLGRVLLLEMLHRFQAHGAEKGLVETNLERTAARKAYESVGFSQGHIVYHQGKWMTNV
ncbi:hypothetical protein KSC_012540 [Ktedonobacter sp. SOSP1-52]|uniref:GNAT family N-acetyltransferase n=1 Tax=Ktedonobacter sp. SOSP1-52 TaxID=2778366 RepID=UPI001A23209E|nr:GNAT family N-acetyltransferase [Ktedonobacter sp. SOSP1-52]GHO62362.1 hypothetical protein KSC_012540 [Ktedonobacter sp. SOSP1-52]